MHKLAIYEPSNQTSPDAYPSATYVAINVNDVDTPHGATAFSTLYQEKWAEYESYWKVEHPTCKIRLFMDVE